MEIDLGNKSILFLASVDKSYILRNNFIENESSQCCLNNAGYFLSVKGAFYVNVNVLVESNDTVLVSKATLTLLK